MLQLAMSVGKRRNSVLIVKLSSKLVKSGKISKLRDKAASTGCEKLQQSQLQIQVTSFLEKLSSNCFINT